MDYEKLKIHNKLPVPIKIKNDKYSKNKMN